MEVVTPLFSSLPLPGEMGLWDKSSAELGIAPQILMENAARAALEVLRAHRGGFAGKSVLVFMGPGNNGGDTVALARHLADEGANVVIVHSRPLGESSALSGTFIAVAKNLGLKFMSAEAWQATMPGRTEIVIDGLLGTGFHGSLKEGEARLIAAINNMRQVNEQMFILALDVPSGLNSQSGRPCPSAVTAHATVCFQAAKPGLVLPHARAFTGWLHVRGIGIPAAVRAQNPASWLCLNLPALPKTKNVFLEEPLPVPGLPAELKPAAYAAPAHKGEAGHVLVLGGAPGMGGAARLAAWAALRAGAGLVTLAALDGGTAEADVMTLPLPEFADTAQYAQQCYNVIAEKISAVRVKALVLGPGLGQSLAAQALAADIIRMPGRPPLVLDADGLAVLKEPGCLAALGKNDVLTPHPGEAARLLGQSVQTVQEDRFAALAALAALAPAAIILKGSGTLLARRGLPSVICPHNVPQLAVAGSGDVLAGLCGAMQAVGHGGLLAAALGVAAHALAGQMLARDFPCRGNTSRDIANALPLALNEIRAKG